MHDDSTPQGPVTQTIGAVTFTDPYAWLHDDTPQALDWMWARDAEAQAAARAWPGFAALKQAIAAAQGPSAFTQTPPRLLGGRWFRAAPSPASPVRALWVSDAADAAGRVIAESAALAGPDDDPASTVVNWFEPSPDGAFVACAVTSRGGMTGHWRIVDVARAEVLPLLVPAIAYSGALPGWLPDAGGFYLAGRSAEGRHCVRFHPVKPGVAPRAERVFDDAEIPATVAGVTIEVAPDGRQAIALAGPHERIALMLGDLGSGHWRPFLPADHQGECQGVWVDPSTYLARVHDANTPRGRVVEIPVDRSRERSAWRERVPQSQGVIKACTVVDGHIVLAEMLDCATRFRVLGRDGRDERVLPLPGPGSSWIAMLHRRFDRSDALTLDFGSFLQTSANYRYEPDSGRLSELGTVQRIEGMTVTQRFATSIDGTRVPYFVVHRADLDLSRPQPALLYAYGGFNVAQPPAPLGHVRPFVEAGGIYLHANLRGGGEYGKAWHDAGRLAAKWNTFADLFAVAEHAIAGGLTTPAQLAMMGGSNGGLLAGCAIVHRPDLWRVVVPVVPIFDMMQPLPLDHAFDAVRAIYFEDYGNPADALMSKVLYSYSPYHNVRPGTAYPAVFSVFGENDLGCRPSGGRKFTAALRAATTSGLPVHLRVWKDTGHGSADPDIAALQPAEWLAFTMQQLGMAYPPPAPAGTGGA